MQHFNIITPCEFSICYEQTLESTEVTIKKVNPEKLET